MNIALFTDSWFPTKSGIVTVVAQLRKILEELGHHVVIVTVTPREKDLNEPIEVDENILRVPSLPSPVGELQYMGFPSRKKVVSFLQEHNVQIIHAHTEFSMGQMAVAAGKKMNVPVIATTHTMWEDFYKHYLWLGRIIPHRTIRYAIKKAYGRFYSLINVSAKAKKYFTGFWVLPRTACAIIPNAVDTESFVQHEISYDERLNLRKELGIKEDDRVMVCVGRVVEEKRVIELMDIIVRVVRQRPNAKMIFVGDGGALNLLKEKAEEANVMNQVIFTGFVDWHKVSSYYAISDFYVTASLSEMHSMTLLEALSLNLPAVCRKDSSFYDTVFPGEDGFFANTDDEMDKYLLKLIDDPELCRKMGENAKKVSESFSLRLHGLRTVAYYEKVLEKFPNKVFSKDLAEAVSSVKE